MPDYKLTPEVRSILERSTINNNTLILPPGQLERKLYEAVNKALTLAGGKWNRSAQGHVFQKDPRAALGLVLETGVAVDHKKRRQAFYTPGALAAELVELANVSGKTVLEPSAGSGALIKECLAQGATSIAAVEIDEEASGALNGMFQPPEVLITNGDFLLMKPGRDIEPVDCVVMNPPFTKNQDVKHVLHGLQFLKQGGVLVAIMAGNTSRPQFQNLMNGRQHEVIKVSACAFKESGTNVQTVMVKITSPMIYV